MAKRKRTHGGKRKGAGRPAILSDSVKLSVRVERKDVDELARLAGDQGVSAYVRKVLDEHLKRRRGRSAGR